VNRFRGWDVLGGSFVNAMMLAGAGIYSFGLFVTPLITEFGLSMKQIFSGLEVFYVSMALWAAIVGRTFNKVSPKTYSILGALAFALGFILISKTTNPIAMLAIVFFLIGFGFTACGPFICNALTTNWFYRLRGRTLGIAAVATSAGGFIMVPIFEKLMSQIGWRSATMTIGIAIAVVASLIAIFIIVAKPEDVGQFPDGATEPVVEIPVASNPRQFLKDRNFWIIAIACGLLLGSDQALMSSLIRYGEERGFSREDAALLVSIVAISAVAGKLLIGWLVEKYDKRVLFALVCLSNIIFLSAAIIAPPYLTMLAVAGVVGMAIGGIYPVWTSITADSFGREHFAEAIGLMNLVTVLFAIASIRLQSTTHDMTGSFELAYKIFIPQAVLAAIVMMFVRVKKEAPTP